MKTETVNIGDEVYLHDLDWCGSVTRVRVIKIHKGGNCIVRRLADNKRIECAIKNLSREWRPLNDAVWSK